MSQQIMQLVEKRFMKPEIPHFEVGDTVDVHCRVVEGDKERIQIFSGVVIARSGSGTREMFTVRRIVQGKGRTEIPVALTDDCQDRGPSFRGGPPGQVVLPAGACGQSSQATGASAIRDIHRSRGGAEESARSKASPTLAGSVRRRRKPRIARNNPTTTPLSKFLRAKERLWRRVGAGAFLREEFLAGFGACCLDLPAYGHLLFQGVWPGRKPCHRR